MCDTGPSDHVISRRSLLGAAPAGTGVVVARALGMNAEELTYA
jgi:diacylglycerol kinase family enzyme